MLRVCCLASSCLLLIRSLLDCRLFVCRLLARLFGVRGSGYLLAVCSRRASSSEVRATLGAAIDARLTNASRFANSRDASSLRGSQSSALLRKLCTCKMHCLRRLAFRVGGRECACAGVSARRSLAKSRVELLAQAALR